MSRQSLTYILLFLLFSNLSIAQTLIGASGSHFKNSQFSLSYAVGEVAIATVKTTNNYLTQGLLQHDRKSSSVQILDACVDLECYPNPTFDLLTVKSKDCIITGYAIYDALGRLCGRSEELVHTISLSALAEGIYFIDLSINGNQLHKSIKITKL